MKYGRSPQWLGLAVRNVELSDLSYQCNLSYSIQQYKVHTKNLPAARVENFKISEFWAKMAEKGVVKVSLDSYY